MVAALLPLQEVNASTAPVKTYLIGIQDSQVCLTLMKNHMPNHCLSYDILKPVDTTNSLISGNWVSFPYYHREKPRVIDHYRFTNNAWVVMVDPNPDFTTKAKMITVTNDNFTWVNTDETVKDNRVRVEHVNRSVSTSCNEATVAPILWLVKDTIQYLESGCTVTKYNDTKVMYVPIPKIDLFGSSWYHNYLWLQQAKQLKQNCIQKCNVTLNDPNVKSGYSYTPTVKKGR